MSSKKAAHAAHHPAAPHGGTLVRETCMVGGKEISIETGRWAKQAGGSVVVRCGDTMVLVTATGSSSPRDIDFMPLTCEYQEKFYASGKIPGSYFRREGRPTTEETLVCRLMDRPVRPLFPKGWFIDTQIIANVISHDKVNPSDVLAMTGASAAITGEKCGPNHVHWVYDTWSMPHGVVDATIKEGGDTWYFITADYAFGHDLEAQVAAVVRGAGGQVLGSARHPLGNADFSSYLLQAQRSRAAVIGLANGGGQFPRGRRA